MIDKLSLPQVQRLARGWLGAGKSVRLHRHARERMGERGVTLQDIEHVLNTGRINTPPEENLKFGNLKFRMMGTLLDGEDAAIVICFPDPNELLVITVFLNDL